MTVARRELITQDTSYYHCISRCVRRAFLYGVDPVTGRDYSHRKQWVIKRLKHLTESFCIDLCAYAVMSNHYHLVLRQAPERAAELTESQVLQRWHQLYSGNELIQRYLAEEPLPEHDLQALSALVATCRERLASISWFMRSLNEPLAKWANKEDNCTGRFWEGRFKSQAILDDVGLLACMAYVDLNPFRAGAVDTPEDSTDISLCARLKAASAKQQPGKVKTSAESADTEQPAESASVKHQAPALLPFADTAQSQTAFEPHQAVLPCTFTDYLALLDWLSKQQRQPDTAYLPQQAPDILQRLKLEPHTLLNALKPGQLSRGTTIGEQGQRQAFAQHQRRSRVEGPNLKRIA